jgi:fibrillarin-like pre-rRNA processing protein
MKRASGSRAVLRHPRALLRSRGDRVELWTEAAGTVPSVYGERWREIDGRAYRSFEPTRSKLAAAIVHGWTGDLPRPGESWLYLGAASGTTASHVADLVGPSGRVFAVEKSVRPFARLLKLSDRWPGLCPILADAGAPEEYFDLVPGIDGIYADIAQPHQVEIVIRNVAPYLRPGGPVLIALKTSSMGRDRPPAGHLAAAERELETLLDLAPSVRLDPFHRAHYLVGGTVTPAGPRTSISSRPSRPRGARRR